MSWSRYLPSTKVVAVCDSLCDTISIKCEGFSEVPVLAISGVVDTCSISTGDGWIRIGKEQVSVPVRHEIEDLKKTRGIRIRLGGLNKVRRNMIVRTQMTFGAATCWLDTSAS